MPTFDRDTLDYFKGNLEREVRDNVEKKLFKTWTALAAAFLVGVGLVGTPWLISYLDGKIASAVQEHVRREASEPTEKAKKLAEEAERVAKSATDSAANSLSEIKLRRQLLDEGLGEMRNKAALVAAEMEKLRGDFTVRAREIDMALKAARDRVSEIDDRAQQQSDRLRNAVPDAAVLASLAVDVKSLVAEIARLGAELKRVAEKAGAPIAAEAEREQQMQIAKLEEAAVQRTAQVQPSAMKLTAYIQFAGLDREYIKGLSAQLDEAGFKVPGEERLAAAAGLQEIRCFYQADCQQAGKMKEVIDGYLASLYKDRSRTMTVKPLFGYTPKPRQGIVEVWLGLANPG